MQCLEEGADGDRILDVRSVDAELLSELEERVHTIANDIAARRGVKFDLGAPTRAAVGTVAPSILAEFQAGAAELRIPTRLMASGASHDAAAFAHAGGTTRDHHSQR